MSLDPEALNTDAEPDECLLPHAAELEAELAAAAALYPLPQSGVEAFAPDTIPLHELGLAGEDARYTHNSERARCKAIAGFTYYWDRAYGDTPSFVLADIGHAQRPRGGGVASMTSFVNDSGLSGHDLQQWTEGLRESVNDGLARSSVLFLTLPRLQVLYYPESPPVWEDEDLTIDLIPPSDLEELFAPGAVPEGITYKELAAQLSKRGRTDFSQEMLDARFNNFVGLAQIELSTIILRDLSALDNTGGSRIKRAQAMALHYKDDIAGDDLMRKQEILREIAYEFKKSAEGVKSVHYKRILGLLSARSRNVATNLDEFMQFFTNAYEAYDGYELPPLLRAPEEPPVQASYVGAAATTVAVEVGVVADGTEEEATIADSDDTAVPEVPEATIADIVARGKVVLDEAANASAAWRMNADSRKGYRAMLRELVDGFRNAVGKQVLDPMIKDHAYELIATLVRIDTLASKNDTDEVAKRIAAAISRQHRVRAQSAELREFAQSVGYTEALPLPQMVDIERRVQTLAVHWPACRQLILKTWPEFGGPDVVKRLDPLFLH